ncbi:MAG TPA: type II toxin-antitoxin system RelE/ParE family toxin [Allosphingosinicella sp.]|nr:type II toxin-antitoxin system RelE/ParE family toxin [Allosphingosinicella sp.]
MSAPIRIVQSRAYRRWFDGLRDRRTRDRILAGVRRLSLGQFGNSKPVAGGLHELRLDYEPGYRVYFATRGDDLLLAWGGDKSRQKADIDRARAIAAEWEAEDGN